MKGKLLSLTLGLCLLAAEAHAGVVEVQFDFSGSSVSLLGGLIQIPPEGSITSAGGTLVVQALGSATPTTGVAVLKNFGMAATVNAITFDNTITGNPSLSQVGVRPGALTPGLSQVIFGGPMQIALAGALNCTGPSCAILSLPQVLTGTQLVYLAGLPLANLANIGNALVSGTFAITFAGLTGTLHLVGNEVSRVFVPEPGSGGLLLLGLVGLAGWRARRALR